MKVVLLTYHFVYNFGANLQALATTRALQARGCQVEIINWRPLDLTEYYNNTVPEDQRVLHEDFVNTYLPQSPLFTTPEDIRDYYLETEHRPDLVIVGSDTTLHVKREGRSDLRYGNPFWLNWLDSTSGLKDIPSAYLSASSTGSWYFLLGKDIRCRMIESLKKRKIITVRDHWTRWMIRTIAPFSFKTPIEDNFDPVFVFNDHCNLTSMNIDRWDLPERYIILNLPRERCTDKWVREFAGIAGKNGYEVLCMPNPHGKPIWEGLRVIHPVHPLEWYKIIQKSSGYVGFLFHPVVVSLSNQVPFVAVDGYGLSPFCLLGGNYPSKTFDICNKAKRRHLVIKSRFFPLYTADKIYRKLTQQDSDTSVFARDARETFERQLDKMLDLINYNDNSL